MKKWWVVLVVTMVSEVSYCQSEYWGYNFEQWNAPEPLIIDTVNYRDNLWVIAAPNKNILNEPVSPPKVIITDSMYVYPINTTSVFYVIHEAQQGYTVPALVSIDGAYFVQSDTLTDYATIEFSPDNGITWIDLASDTTYDTLIDWWAPGGPLSGESNQWKTFHVEFGLLGPAFNIQLGDTVIYKFKFVSDSIMSGREGIMFDNLNFADDFPYGISDFHLNKFHLSPNPVSTELHITLDEPNNNGTVSLMSYEGTVISHQEMNSASATLDVSAVAPGMYYVLFRSEKVVAVKKMVVAR